MTPSFNFFAILNLLGVAQAILLALVLLTLKRGNQTTNRTLAALLLSITCLTCANLLLNTRYILLVPHLAQLHAPLHYALAPLFYLYVRTLIQPGFCFSRRTSWHFVPVGVYVLYLLPFYLQSAADKVALSQASPPAYGGRVASSRPSAFCGRGRSFVIWWIFASKPNWLCR